MRVALLACSVASIVIACSPQPAPSTASAPDPVQSAPAVTPASSAPAAQSAAAGAPTPSAPTPAAPPAATPASTLPAIDDVCKASADCTIYMQGRADDVCCPGCDKYKGASKASLDKFRAACMARGAPCAGSCAAPKTHAECKAGRCVAVVDPP